MAYTRVEIGGRHVAYRGEDDELILGAQQTARLVNASDMDELAAHIRAASSVRTIASVQNLTDLDALAAGLRSGEDVSLQLGLLELTMPEDLVGLLRERDDVKRRRAVLDDQLRALNARRDDLIDALLDAVRQRQLDELRAQVGNMELTGDQLRELSRWRLTARTITNSSGYTIGVKTAERIWRAAAPLWADCPALTSGPRLGYVDGVRAHGGQRTASIYAGGVSVGCQNVERWLVNHLAVHYGWLERAS